MTEVELECAVYGEATVFPDGAWLSGGQNVEDLLRGDIDTTYKKMFSWWKLNKTEYFGDFQLGEEEIHVLVELRYPRFPSISQREIRSFGETNETR
ncbi:hypothetical protein Plhal710r2_c006g0028061 [Plasmopara halstedii]